MFLFKSWAKKNNQKLLFGWKEKPNYKEFREFLRVYKYI